MSSRLVDPAAAEDVDALIGVERCRGPTSLQPPPQLSPLSGVRPQRIGRSRRSPSLFGAQYPPNGIDGVGARRLSGSKRMRTLKMLVSPEAAGMFRWKSPKLAPNASLGHRYCAYNDCTRQSFSILFLSLSIPPFGDSSATRMMSKLTRTPDRLASSRGRCGGPEVTGRTPQV